MSLSKAIKSGKEHRIEYGTQNQPYCKAIDSTCRNHGSCPWCCGNRLNKKRFQDRIAKKEIKDFLNK